MALEQFLVWEANPMAMTKFNLLGVHTSKADAIEHCIDADAYAKERGSAATHWVATPDESRAYPYIETGNGPCGRKYRAWLQGQKRRGAKCR